MQRTTIVMDNGTGYTKMGFAGTGSASNHVPSFVIPTIIAQDKNVKKAGGKKRGANLGDLDFYIGNQADDRRKTMNVSSPISEGIVEDWDAMEKFWNRCIYGYLQCNPEDHYMLLTEPPLNPPENREYSAEIMFETFQSPGLYIGVQAVLALIASKISQNADKVMTGTVVDSGDGVTHVIPVVDGFTIGSCIKHIPLAGSHVTAFIKEMLRERKEPIPAVDIMNVARRIKERYCYAVPKLDKEFEKYDKNPEDKFKVYEGLNGKTGKTYTVDVGYERFLGPELFFNPEIFSADHDTPLPNLVDDCIQGCPIDSRRLLYRNICLSGGSTMFKDFNKRLGKDIKSITKARINAVMEQSGSKVEHINVNVITHRMQRFAVWFGGAMLSQLPQFSEMVIKKEDYDEIGPRVARYSRVLKSV